MIHVSTAVRRVLPRRYRMPASYYFHRALGTLEPEVGELWRWVRGGETAIDVGANNGIYSYKLLRLGATVEAFEPLPDKVRDLKRYRHDRFRVHPLGLSDIAGSRSLFVPRVRGRREPGLASLEGGFEVAEELTVVVKPLDTYEFRDVALIKVDVEGHELGVLKGGARTIQLWKPVLIVEVEDGRAGAPWIDTFDLVARAGYTPYYVGECGLVELRDWTRAGWSPSLLNSRTSRFINNFIFLPAKVTRPSAD